MVCGENYLALGFLSMTGWADLGEKGQREAGFAVRDKETWECTGQRRRNGGGVEMAVRSFGTEVFAGGFVCLAFASSGSRMRSLANSDAQQALGTKDQCVFQPTVKMW